MKVNILKSELGYQLARKFLSPFLTFFLASKLVIYKKKKEKYCQRIDSKEIKAEISRSEIKKKKQ